MKTNQTLILKKTNGRWKNVENGHTNYGLENALQEVFTDTNERLFRIEENKVYQITSKKEKDKK